MRGECCQRCQVANGPSSVVSMPALMQTSTSNCRSIEPDVNLLHMKLFHHFQTQTVATLSGAPGLWEHALQLSFGFKFVMNAMLCIAARHLAILAPEDPAYPTVARRHLSRTLSQFQYALSKPSSSIHLDSFIITSILLHYELWVDIDFTSLEDDDGAATADLSKDSIFSFCSSMKQAFMKFVPEILDQPSACVPHIQHDDEVTLVRAAHIDCESLAVSREFFSISRHLGSNLFEVPIPRIGPTTRLDCSNEPLGTHTLPIRTPIEGRYEAAVERLCLILSYLPDGHAEDFVNGRPPMLAELARYIISFPVRCHGTFALMVEQCEPHALLVLFHFYRAVRILLPADEYWWASRRARSLENILKHWLMDEIKPCAHTMTSCRTMPSLVARAPVESTWMT